MPRAPRSIRWLPNALAISQGPRTLASITASQSSTASPRWRGLVEARRRRLAGRPGRGRRGRDDRLRVLRCRAGGRASALPAGGGGLRGDLRSGSAEPEASSSRQPSAPSAMATTRPNAPEAPVITATRPETSKRDSGLRRGMSRPCSSPVGIRNVRSGSMTATTRIGQPSPSGKAPGEGHERAAFPVTSSRSPPMFSMPGMPAGSSILCEGSQSGKSSSTSRPVSRRYSSIRCGMTAPCRARRSGCRAGGRAPARRRRPA